MEIKNTIKFKPAASSDETPVEFRVRQNSASAYILEGMYNLEALEDIVASLKSLKEAHRAAVESMESK